jgi:hypothetical protein
LARSLETGDYVAIKIIQRFSKKRRLGRVTVSPEDKTKREIAILKRIRHADVVGLLEVIDDPELKKIIGLTQRSAKMKPEDKVKFLKAAWDAVGSEFGSRHTQYEMFYAGARFVTTGHSYRTFDWADANGMVDSLMTTYDLSDELSRIQH